MKSKLFASAKKYVKSVGAHVSRVVTKDETFSEAWQDIAHDTKKLRKSVRGKQVPEGRKGAARLVEVGRQHYNQGRFDDAAESFRSAILEDERYGLAYTYLGYTLYKQGRLAEAGMYWDKAIEMEPGSEAAQKAEKKLAMLRAKRKKVDDWINERQR